MHGATYTRTSPPSIPKPTSTEAIIACARIRFDPKYSQESSFLSSFLSFTRRSQEPSDRSGSGGHGEARHREGGAAVRPGAGRAAVGVHQRRAVRVRDAAPGVGPRGAVGGGRGQGGARRGGGGAGGGRRRERARPVGAPRRRGLARRAGAVRRAARARGAPGSRDARRGVRPRRRRLGHAGLTGGGSRVQLREGEARGEPGARGGAAVAGGVGAQRVPGVRARRRAGAAAAGERAGAAAPGEPLLPARRRRQPRPRPQPRPRADPREPELGVAEPAGQRAMARGGAVQRAQGVHDAPERRAAPREAARRRAGAAQPGPRGPRAAQLGGGRQAEGAAHRAALTTCRTGGGPTCSCCQNVRFRRREEPNKFFGLVLACNHGLLIDSRISVI